VSISAATTVTSRRAVHHHVRLPFYPRRRRGQGRQESWRTTWRTTSQTQKEAARGVAAGPEVSASFAGGYTPPGSGRHGQQRTHAADRPPVPRRVPFVPLWTKGSNTLFSFRLHRPCRGQLAWDISRSWGCVRTATVTPALAQVSPCARGPTPSCQACSKLALLALAPNPKGRQGMHPSQTYEATTQESRQAKERLTARRHAVVPTRVRPLAASQAHRPAQSRGPGAARRAVRDAWAAGQARACAWRAGCGRAATAGAEPSGLPHFLKDNHAVPTGPSPVTAARRRR
jgi:hypothetical protein